MYISAFYTSQNRHNARLCEKGAQDMKNASFDPKGSVKIFT
jgi:hypothetical protein